MPDHSGGRRRLAMAIAVFVLALSRPVCAEDATLAIRVVAEADPKQRIAVKVLLPDGSTAAAKTIAPNQVATLKFRTGQSFNLRVEAAGYETVTMPPMTILPPNNNWTTDIKLQRPAKLLIVAPAGTRVSLNGRERGTVGAARTLVVSSLLYAGRRHDLSLTNGTQTRRLSFVAKPGTGIVLFGMTALPAGVSSPARSYWIEPPSPPARP